MKEYKPRIADKLLKYRMEEVGAVLVEGPKWCGKTTTAEQQAKSVLYMSDPDNRQAYLELADLKIKMLLKGDNPRLIDEWQIVPQIWDAIRFDVDHRGEEGLYILTGSAVPVSTDNIHHTGTGRFAWITMRPMTLWESGESTGDVSLEQLFRGVADVEGYNRLKLEDIAFLVCRGGWLLTKAVVSPYDRHTTTMTLLSRQMSRALTRCRGAVSAHVCCCVLTPVRKVVRSVSALFGTTCWSTMMRPCRTRPCSRISVL